MAAKFNLAGKGVFTYRVARFIMDPRDARGDTEWFDVVSGLVRWDVSEVELKLRATTYEQA